MSLRSKWEFAYTASALAKAAEAQRDHRNSRVTEWEAKKAEVVEKIKSSGLTVHEGPAATMYTNTSNSGGAHVMVDTTLQADLSQCVDRIKLHREAAKSYDAWAQVLNANPKARVQLDHDDWMFFFGK